MKSDPYHLTEEELKVFGKELDALFRDAAPWWRYYRWKLIRFFRYWKKRIRLKRREEK